ncbi:coronin-2A-like isoform X1 [Oncorhynchus tshawytscha]|uniref:coronin-2A-like isoform X1 n=1 Tax=Oncorhynchus tshawytscha TaxID=74940 RepID=UPI001C3DDE6A|nr:coronin-2A-like isoform X1 [Oncorhynchus tshawytscha]
MSWCPPYRSSKFRHVYGKASTKDHGYHGIPITHSVHDNHYCSVNPRFIAIVTECSGGGAFLVLSIHHTGKVDPQHPRVCGHSARVLDVKWNPFDDHCIASCSEDCTVKLWDIPANGVYQNMTLPRKVLQGHSRRVNLIEWHPTARDLLVSSAYDYKVMVWDVSVCDSVLRNPVCVISLHTELVLSMSFNNDGSSLATTSLDKKIRVMDPRTGRLIQVSSSKLHRANKVVFIGDQNMLFSTGSSPWNQRQITLWDPDDLSEPLSEEEVDGGAGVLFPFYDPDTHILYLAGKGDGNIRYYEISSEKPYVQFLTEYYSLLPQKGLGVMPKRGLDVSSCEVFRFYRLVTVKDLVEPLSMIVPRRSPKTFQDDIFPMTAGNEAALTAQQWLSGINRGPVLMCLKPGSKIANPYPETLPRRGLSSFQSGGPEDTGSTEQAFLQEQLAYQDAKYPREVADLSGWQPDETQAPGWAYTPHCCEPSECPPPRTESELLQAFYRQQEEIRGLRDQLNQKKVQITQLELEIKNTRNNMRATF